MRKLKAELPDGGWAEIRDSLKGKDKFAVQRALMFDISEAGTTKISAELMTTITNTLLAQLITTWSLTDPQGQPLPVPSLIPDPPGTDPGTGPSRALGELDIDVYNALEEAIQPFVKKVMQTPNPVTPSG